MSIIRAEQIFIDSVKTYLKTKDAENLNYINLLNAYNDAITEINGLKTCTPQEKASFTYRLNMFKGEVLYDMGEYAQAVLAYKQVSEECVLLNICQPAQVYFGVGQAFRKLGRHDKALFAYKLSINRAPLGPYSAMAHYWIGCLLKNLGMYQQALQELGIALALSPAGSRPEAHFVAGEIFSLSGNDIQAINAYNYAIRETASDNQGNRLRLHSAARHARGLIQAGMIEKADDRVTAGVLMAFKPSSGGEPVTSEPPKHVDKKQKLENRI